MCEDCEENGGFVICEECGGQGFVIVAEYENGMTESEGCHAWVRCPCWA